MEWFLLSLGLVMLKRSETWAVNSLLYLHLSLPFVPQTTPLVLYLHGSSADSLQMDKWSLIVRRAYHFLAITVSIRFVLVVMVHLDFSYLQHSVVCKLKFIL